MQLHAVCMVLHGAALHGGTACIWGAQGGTGGRPKPGVSHPLHMQQAASCGWKWGPPPAPPLPCLGYLYRGGRGAGASWPVMPCFEPELCIQATCLDIFASLWQQPIPIAQQCKPEWALSLFSLKWHYLAQYHCGSACTAELACIGKHAAVYINPQAQAQHYLGWGCKQPHHGQACLGG